MKRNHRHVSRRAVFGNTVLCGGSLIAEREVRIFPGTAHLIAILAERMNAFVSYDIMHDLTYGHLPDGGPSQRVFLTYAHWAKKALRQAGSNAGITNRPSLGYRMSVCGGQDLVVRFTPQQYEALRRLLRLKEIQHFRMTAVVTAVMNDAAIPVGRAA